MFITDSIVSVLVLVVNSDSTVSALQVLVHLVNNDEHKINVGVNCELHFQCLPLISCELE